MTNQQHTKELISKVNRVKIQKCYLEIFKLVVEEKIDYTLNRNGVFFNMTPLPEATLKKIDDIVDRHQPTSDSRAS